MLTIENLSKEFPVEKGIFSQSTSTVKAVQEVSFNIEKNKVLGLVGESGSGKSTLGKTIMKLLNPTKGQIIFDNENITNYNNRQMIAIRKKLQMMVIIVQTIFQYQQKLTVQMFILKLN